MLSDITVSAIYPTTSPVLFAGYIENDDVIRGSAAVVDAPMGPGHVVLLAPNVLYRAQATADHMFFWNSLIEGGR